MAGFLFTVREDYREGNLLSTTYDLFDGMAIKTEAGTIAELAGKLRRNPDIFLKEDTTYVPAYPDTKIRIRDKIVSIFREPTQSELETLARELSESF